MAQATNSEVTLIDKTGETITVRLAVPEDFDAVRDHIADHTGTGAGGGGDKDVAKGDEFLLKEFNDNVKDPNMTVLFAETTAEKTGLGLFAIAWSSETESYWQSLRIASAARKRGIAGLLFRHAARLALARQGPESIARWGIVSNNQIMVDWSTRMKLHGPQRFRRHSAQASLETVEGAELPEGFELRPITEADISTVMAAVPSFTFSKSEFGTQNFVTPGWAEFSEAVLRGWMTGKSANSSMTVVASRQLVDDSGAVVGLSVLAKMQFGPMSIMFHGYTDAATPELVRLLLHALPAVAHAEGANMVGGYVAVMDWTVELFEKSPVYTRMTETEQLEFHWHNRDFADDAA